MKSIRKVLLGSGKHTYMTPDEFKAFRRARRWQGGLSLEVVASPEFIQYAARAKGVFGYIGASERTPERDRIVEELLRATGLGANGLASWLSSGNGRHLMDDPGESIAEFRKRAKDYTKRAFLQVAIWSHPDHGGMMRSSLELEKKLRAALADTKEVA
jgi:hypothetical protein